MENDTFMKLKKSTLIVLGGFILSTGLVLSQLSHNSILAFAAGNLPAPSSASIATNPIKLTYLTGETFDPTGLSLHVNCNTGFDFMIAYNENTASKFYFSTDPLTKDTKNISVSYVGPNGTASVSVPISVDNYRIDEVDIYENASNRIMFSIGGAYGDGYQTKTNEAEFYIVPNGDIFKYDSVAPVTTPDHQDATYGTFTAEIDITDMPLSDRSKVLSITNKSGYEQIYWPHFIMENDDGQREDKDLRFPNLTMKEISRTGDSDSETYILNIYANSSTNKYIPVVARTTTDDMLEYEYYYTTSDTTYTFPADIERGYMPVGVDIANVNGRAIWSVSGKFKGFTRLEDFFRCFSFYMYRYPSNTTPDGYYKGFNGAVSNHGLSRDDVVFVLETADTGTFTLNVDITDYAVSEASRPGYWTRMSNNITGGSCDCKNADDVNNGKYITIGGKVYTVMNVAPSTTASKTNSWGCLGFKITNA